MAATDATGGGDKAVPEQATPKLGLDLTKDSLTRGDKASGLGEVFVQMDTNALADDVADLALGALKKRGIDTPWNIRVVTDPAALRGADVLAMLTHQADAIAGALDATLDVPVMAAAPEEYTFLVAPIMGVAPAVGAALQGVGILSKLLAHDYQMNGKEVDPNDLGFDLLVAHQLTIKHPDGVHVTVDRIAPSTVASTAIATSLSDIEERARTELAPYVTAKAAIAASAASDVTALTSQRDALNAQLLKLMEKIDQPNAVTEIANVRAELATTTNALTMARAIAATCQAEHAAVDALAKEIDAFLTSATTTPATGRAPLVEAARAASLSGGCYVLYVHLVAGGMDEIVDLRAIRSDHWTTLAGATVEFALLDGDGVVTSGVRSTLQATEFDLGNVRHNKQDYLRYVDVPAFQP